MRILMLADLYPPVIGGAERHVESLAGELSRRGHAVTVCTIGGPGLAAREDKGGVKVYRLEGFFQRIPFLFKDPGRKLHPPAPDWLLTRQLCRILKAERFDIIHAHGRIVYSALALKRNSGIPLVVTLHSYALFCPKTDLLKNNRVCDRGLAMECIACGKNCYGLAKSLLAYCATRVNRGKLRLVDRFIAVSPFARRVSAQHLGLNYEDMAVVPNWYDPAADGRSEEVVNLPEDFILFVGGLNPAKGAHVLIRAFRELHSSSKLVLIGTTHPDHRYESTTDISVIENAPHAVVMQAMSRCRFAVFPSIVPEHFAIVALEAMSQKKAVIASGLGGFKDVVVDGETGILVPPNDSGKLAESMSYLLQRQERASQMGEKGYQRFIGNYTPDTVIPMVEQVYSSLL